MTYCKTCGVLIADLGVTNHVCIKSDTPYVSQIKVVQEPFQGWVCVKCQKIRIPYRASCDCSSNERQISHVNPLCSGKDCDGSHGEIGALLKEQKEEHTTAVNKRE